LMQELKLIKQTVHGRWIVLGDFNLICRAQDKSNEHINLRLLNGFRQVLDELELREFHLQGRKYIWSSGTTNLTQTKIDHVSASREWELAYPHCYLQAISSSVSDHCPILLTSSPPQRRFKGFMFEAFWLRMPEFHQIVAKSWAAPVRARNKAQALHIKLSSLAKTLKRWNQNMIEDMKDTLAAQETIMRLDQLQEARQLISAELQQRLSTKDRVLGLAAVRKFKLKHRSCLTWIRIGDANSKLFHLRVDARH
jgi:hypothetical protein